MAVSGYIPRVAITLEGGNNEREIHEGSEATIRVRVLNQSGALVADVDVTDVAYALFNKADGAAINSQTAVKANGTVTQSGQVSENDTVTINGLVYTFKASPAAARDVDIGIDADGSMDNLEASVLLNDPLVTASYGTPTLTLTATTPGTNGNDITLAKTATNLTVSGANLTSGTDGTDAGANVADQRFGLIAADNVISDGGVAEGASEAHVLRIIVKFVSGINDIDANALDTVIKDFEFNVRKSYTPVVP